MTHSTAKTAGSHEESVRHMRDHWRTESVLRTCAQEREADREKAHGDRMFMSFVEANRSLLARYALGYFGGDKSLVDDGVQELILALYQELRRLSDSVHSRLWETRFGYCLRALANTLFVQKLQRRYGKTRAQPDPENSDSDRAIIEQKQSERLTGDGDFDPYEASPDLAAEEAFAALLAHSEAESLLRAIPDRTLREALILSCSGWKQERIAARQGCTAKTVYNRIARATIAAAAWARERYQTHGEFSDRFGRTDT